MEKRKKRVLLISIIPRLVSDSDALVELREVKSLIEAYEAELTEVLIQRREVHDKGMYIGSGKIDEAGQIVREKHIDIVVLNAIVKPGQLYDMKQLLFSSNRDIEVWDRVDLILGIFSRHAHTAEAKLQIELAAMRHMGPRIYGMGLVLSRQTGGIGTRGVGETNTELMKRHWREQIKKTHDKLEKLASDRKRQLERRQKNGLQTVSIIGYTNAGKTSLFNHLSGKNKLAKDELFATLDSSVGKLYLPEKKDEVLISDTIGFIQNLPAKLIDAFKSTLMESIHADLLLHVIDVSDSDFEKKIEVVENILTDLKIDEKRRVYVFNKIDAVESIDRQYLKNKYKDFSPLFISLKEEKGIEGLIKTIEENVIAF